MAGGINNNYQIVPLQKDNYEALLIRGGLWGYVTGEIPAPPTTAAETTKKCWVKEDLNARSDLLLII